MRRIKENKKMDELISNISNKLVYKDGIWFSAKNKATISYPEGANQAFFDIEEKSFWFNHRNNCILSVINKYAKTKLLFDIGGGNGYTALSLQKNGINTVIVEPEIDGVLNSQKRGIKNLICSTFSDAEFIDNSIPNIGIFDVLEHIENDVDFLSQLNNKLKNDGKLFITVPAYSLLWSNEDVKTGHYRRYTLKSLRKILIASNFKIEYSTYFFSILIFPIFIFRTLPSLFTKKLTEDLVDENEHTAVKSKSILDSIWKKELNYINRNKKINFGGSCLIVASKK